MNVVGVLILKLEARMSVTAFEISCLIDNQTDLNSVDRLDKLTSSYSKDKSQLDVLKGLRSQLEQSSDNQN